MWDFFYHNFRLQEFVLVNITGNGVFPGREILTPSSLAQRLQNTLDRELGSVWVEGEISDLSLPRSGHAYFQLKEVARGQEARIKAVMWKGRRSYAGGALTEGLLVLARGRLSVYAPRGDVQLTVDYLEPRGEGALRLAFENLKARLTAQGLFKEERKRSLPFWVKKVAVVSSPSGAAVRDFIHTAQRLRPGAHISLYPVRVQGEGSVKEIVAALDDLNAWGGYDLIVLTRGGGSLADLWSFNEEEVVRAVVSSRIPVLAAIGHSTDLTLAELAADGRAITPTAAAETVFRDQAALMDHVEGCSRRLVRGMRETIALRSQAEEQAHLRLIQAGVGQLRSRQREHLELTRRLGRFEDRLGHAGQHLDYYTERLERGVRGRIHDIYSRLETAVSTLRLLSPAPRMDTARRELAGLEHGLRQGVLQGLQRDGQRLDALVARLQALSPRSILGRGYAAVTTGSKRQPVTRACDLVHGQEVRVLLAEGQFTSEVKSISYDEQR